MGILFFTKELGLNPKKVASTNGGEYHSACPACGGKDRFIIWDRLNRYFCRQCNKKGDGIQYCRDFYGLSYAEACKKSGALPKKRSDAPSKESIPPFDPKIACMPPLEWKSQAKVFLLYCHEQLKKNQCALDLLFKRGFSRETIDQFHLGWNPSPLWLKRSSWGLELEEKKLWIPKGLLIPSFDSSTGEPVKLKTRRSDWKEEDRLPKYVEVSGSIQSPAMYGNLEDRPIVVVESELDAILLQQYAGDLCCSMALGGASKKPDATAHQLLLKTPVILFCLDVDSAGAAAYRFWDKTYPRMKLWLPPIEKSLGDAYLAGVDLREWMKQGLSPLEG